MGEDDKGRVVESKLEREEQEYQTEQSNRDNEKPIYKEEIQSESNDRGKDGLLIKIGYGSIAVLVIMCLITVSRTDKIKEEIVAAENEIENYEPYIEDEVQRTEQREEVLNDIDKQIKDLERERGKLIERNEIDYTGKVEEEGDIWREVKNRQEKIESEIDYYGQETRRLDREALDYRMETWGFEY